MAGLGEACSHIAAVLFYLEALARMQGTKMCTQEECQWIIPSYLKAIEYLLIKDIDFTSLMVRINNKEMIPRCLKKVKHLQSQN